MKIQFSIRDLLVIVAFAALATGWWIDHRRLVALHANYQKKLWVILDSGTQFGPWNVKDENGFSDDNIDLIYPEALQAQRSIQQIQQQK
jgi:hypothetical protein